MMALLADDTVINPWILMSIIVLIVLVSVVGLIASITFQIKFWGGRYEEKLNTPKDKSNDD